MKHLALKAFYSLILVLMASTAYGQADNEARKDILELRRRVQYLDSKIQAAPVIDISIGNELILAVKKNKFALPKNFRLPPFDIYLEDYNQNDIDFKRGDIDSRKAILELRKYVLFLEKTLEIPIKQFKRIDQSFSPLTQDFSDNDLRRAILDLRSEISRLCSEIENKKANNIASNVLKPPLTTDSQSRATDQKETQSESKPSRIIDDRRRPDDDKRELPKTNQRINLQVNNTQPSADGDVTINVQTNADTASLKINGEEQGGRSDGKYSLKRVARAGQETRFEIYAKDIYGNSETKIITVSRTVVESKVTYPALNPDRIKRQPEHDAVAIIIGISNYKSLPKAEYAKDDAQVFFDYAIRALGVRPGNIKLLMDEQADAEEIYTAFKTWLPARVKFTTDVYVFYSGPGLPTQDGSGLYWLPQRANRDLLAKTAILLQEITSDIQASMPNSVTIFMDACYSGQARGGETLIASARPIALKSQSTTFPSNFTVISASQADQISSSSPDLQHGIFSYYLMRGMEGEADLNKNGKITLDEIQAYLSENVGRQARIMNRQQEPQVIGDGATVLVGSKLK